MINLEALKRVNIPTKWKLVDFSFAGGSARLLAKQSALLLQVGVDTESVQTEGQAFINVCQVSGECG